MPLVPRVGLGALSRLSSGSCTAEIRQHAASIPHPHSSLTTRCANPYIPCVINILHLKPPSGVWGSNLKSSPPKKYQSNKYSNAKISTPFHPISVIPNTSTIYNTSTISGILNSHFYFFSKSTPLKRHYKTIKNTPSAPAE